MCFMVGRLVLENIDIALESSFIFCLQADIGISYLKDAILNFSLLVTSYNNPNSHSEQLDLENIKPFKCI